MTSPKNDPVRWKVDPDNPGELAEAMQELGARGPSDQQIARMAASLGMLPPVPPPPSPPSGGGGLPIWKISTGAVIAAIAIGGGMVWTSRPAPIDEPTTRALVPNDVPESIPEPIDVPRDEVIRAEVSERDEAPLPPMRLRRRSSPPSVAPTQSEEPAPPIAPEVQQDDVASRLREEAALIQRAEAMLGRDPRQAFALAEQHRRRFENGTMSQEREVIAIDALLRIGRGDAARERARIFDAAHGDSVHRRRIRRLVSP